MCIRDSSRWSTRSAPVSIRVRSSVWPAPSPGRLPWPSRTPSCSPNGGAHGRHPRGEIGQHAAQAGHVLIAAPPFGEQLGVLDGHGSLPGDGAGQTELLTRILTGALLVDHLEDCLLYTSDAADE